MTASVTNSSPTTCGQQAIGIVAVLQPGHASAHGGHADRVAGGVEIAGDPGRLPGGAEKALALGAQGCGR
jgi:hypothetical protein